MFREANNVADVLAKHSHSITAPQMHFDVNQIPKDAKAYYFLDKVGMVAFRRRKLKKIKEPPWVYCFCCFLILGFFMLVVILILILRDSCFRMFHRISPFALFLFSFYFVRGESSLFNFFLRHYVLRGVLSIGVAKFASLLDMGTNRPTLEGWQFVYHLSVEVRFMPPSLYLSLFFIYNKAWGCLA